MSDKSVVATAVGTVQALHSRRVPVPFDFRPRQPYPTKPLNALPGGRP
jgi:hypothetical protein